MSRSEDKAAPGPAGDHHIEAWMPAARSCLKAAARRGVPITYQRLATDLGLPPPQTIHKTTRILEALMADDAAAGRPFLAALVISRHPARGGMPAPGFFDCAAALGRFRAVTPTADPSAYYAREFAAAVSYWRRLDGGADQEGAPGVEERG